MDFTGFANSFTEGEIAPEAWDRIDIQPVGKGVEAGINTVVTALGPLRKRRGFWDISAIADQTKLGRLIPWRRGSDDALMLEFGDSSCRVWLSNGAPLLNPGPGAQVTFATPYTDAEAQNLRFKQVEDVIYFRTSDGLAPQALSRVNGGVANADWTFTPETFPNGPWLGENTDLANTVTLTNTAGPADIFDANPNSHAGAIPAGATVTINAADPIFAANMVGAQMRLRVNGSSLSAFSWSPGTKYRAGAFVISVGNMYIDTQLGTTAGGSTPPVQLQGSQSDGDNIFDYLHDGAGVVLITGFTDVHNVTANVVHTVPFASATPTSYWAFGAYSDAQGWPTAWPEIREERLAEGGPSGNPDFADLTQTAGFTPTSEDFTPGTGLGQITDINSIRRRVGNDGSPIQWFCVANYLICGTETGEFLVAGSVLDEPLTPAGITIKQLSSFGCDPVAPAQLWNGLCFVQQGGGVLRWLSIDTQQGYTKDDYSVFATHIAQRGMTQLAWLRQDQVLYLRLADGGLAAMTFHQEQAVRGWTRMQLPGGWICEDMAVIPGPGRFDTLWLKVSRTKAGVTQRRIWQQSEIADALFIDGADLYEGAPATVITGLTQYEGETVRVLADGAQVDGLVVDGAGHVTLAKGASTVQVGLAYQPIVKSLRLSVGYGGGTLNKRQRLPNAVISMTTAAASYGLCAGDDQDGNPQLVFAGPPELVTTRAAPGVAVAKAKRIVREVTLSGDGAQEGRDPRILIVEDSAYDFILYSISPAVDPGG
jgi:hypothetical protein